MTVPALTSRRPRRCSAALRLAALITAAILCVGQPSRAQSVSAESTLSNRQYELTVGSDHGIDLAVAGVPAQRLLPEFTVMYSDRNPGFGMNHIARFNGDSPRPFPSLPWFAQRWAFYSNDPAAPARDYDPLGATSDITLTVNSAGQRFLHYRDAKGQEVSTRETTTFKGTPDPYLAGRKTVLRAIASALDGRAITWQFADQPDFSLKAEVVLPADGGDPQIRYELHARKAGFYSIALT